MRNFTFWIFFAFSLLTTLYVEGQEAELDSLLSVTVEQRDTAWVDFTLKASYGIVYDNPQRTSSALREVAGLAEKKRFSRRSLKQRAIKKLPMISPLV